MLISTALKLEEIRYFDTIEQRSQQQSKSMQKQVFIACFFSLRSTVYMKRDEEKRFWEEIMYTVSGNIL